MRAALVAALLVAGLCVSGVARADDDWNEPPPDDIPDGWHADAIGIADLPLGPHSITNVTSIAGGVVLRGYWRWLDLSLENVLFAEQDTTAPERLKYRTRFLAGWRHARVLVENRAIVFRAAGGVELDGFDPVSSATFVANSHRVGFAVEAGVESRSQLSWGVVTLSGALALSASPFGDAAKDQVTYIGVEVIAGAGVGF